MSHPWNKGKHLSEEYRKKISIGKTGIRFKEEHKQAIAISQKKRLASVKQCSNCSIKSRWIYRVSIPSITDYPLMLCDECIILQFFHLTPEEKQKVIIG